MLIVHIIQFLWLLNFFVFNKLPVEDAMRSTGGFIRGCIAVAAMRSKPLLQGAGGQAQAVTSWFGASAGARLGSPRGNPCPSRTGRAG